MVCCTRLAAGHINIFIHTTRKPTGTPPRRRRPRRVAALDDVEARYGVAAAEPFYGDTAVRRRRGAVSCPTDQPRDASYCIWVQPKPSTTPAATEPTGRRGRRRRDIEHGLRDASPCVYPVASRASSIADTSRRSAVQLRRPRGRPGPPPRAPENTRARRHFVTRRRASTGPAHEVLTSKRSLWRRGATRFGRGRSRPRSRPRARARVFPEPRSRRGASSSQILLHATHP